MEPGIVGGNIWQVSLSLFFVLGLITLLAYLYKRTSIGQGRGNESFKIISSMAIGAKEKLVLIEVGESQFLIGVTNHSINKIHQLSEEEKVTLSAKSEKTFSKKLKEALKKA